MTVQIWNECLLIEPANFRSRPIGDIRLVKFDAGKPSFSAVLPKQSEAQRIKGQGVSYHHFRRLELEMNSYDEAQGANRMDLAHTSELEIMRSRVEALRAKTVIAQQP